MFIKLKYSGQGEHLIVFSIINTFKFKKSLSHLSFVVTSIRNSLATITRPNFRTLFQNLPTCRHATVFNQRKRGKFKAHQNFKPLFFKIQHEQ